MDELNRKEDYIIRLYKEKFENRTFDETDVCFFVMLLRSHINKAEFPYIVEFGDAIAHRKRKQGKAYSSMRKAEENNYQLKPNSNSVKGYDGINNAKWKNEWSKIGERFNINFSDKAVKEILICMISALQFSEYENLGKMELICSKDSLAIATVGNAKYSPFIYYAVAKDVKIEKELKSPIIKEPVFALRINDELQLVDKNGDRII